MRIEHEIHATIPAPIETVWTLLGSFGDMSWNPDITACALIGGDTRHVGSIREMHTREGTTIRERLDAIGPGYSFAYSFDGVPPGPVSSSSITVTAASAAAAPDAATTVTWRGVFDVADEHTGHLSSTSTATSCGPPCSAPWHQPLASSPSFTPQISLKRKATPHDNLK